MTSAEAPRESSSAAAPQKPATEHRLFVITDASMGQRKTLMVRARNAEGGYDDHSAMTARELLEKVRTNETFGTDAELSCVSYRSPTLAFRVPDSVRPLELFPQLVISLGDVSSPDTPVLVFGNASTLELTFKDANGCLPDVTVSMPFAVTDHEETDIAKLMLNLAGDLTWATLIDAAAKQLKVSSDRVILRHICDGVDYIFFPFGSVGEDLQRFFRDEDGKKVLKSVGGCYFDVVVGEITVRERVESEMMANEVYRELVRALNAVSECDVLEALVKIIAPYFLREVQPAQEELLQLATVFDSAITYRMERFIGKYCRVAQFEITKWKDLVTWFREKDFDLCKQEAGVADKNILAGLRLLEWETFPQEFFNCLLLASSSFGKLIGSQNAYFFGTIVYLGLVNLNEKYECAILLSKAFLIIVNMIPKLQGGYVTMPKSVVLPFSIENPVYVRLPLFCTSVSPLLKSNHQCLIQTNNGHFVIRFNNVSAMRDFWLMYEITKYQLKQPIIKPGYPDVGVEISFPLGSTGRYTFRASVAAVGERWDVHLPLSKFVKKLEPKVLRDRDSRYTMIDTSVEMPEVPAEFQCDLHQKDDFGFKSDAFWKSIHEYKVKIPNIAFPILYATTYEFITTPTQSYLNMIMKTLKVTDFYQPFRLKSVRLLQWQLKHFGTYCQSFKMRRAPLLHIVSLFADDVRLLKLVMDSCDVNDVDDDGRTALFYSLENRSAVDTQLLIEHGIDVDKGDSSSSTPMTYAINNNLAERGLILAGFGASMNKTLQSFHDPALIWALRNSCDEVFEALVPFCTEELNYPTKRGEFLTHICIQQRRPHALLVLARQPKFDPNLYSGSYAHPLLYYLSAGEGQADLLDALLMLPKLNVNFRGSDGQTALCRGIISQQAEFVKRLIQDPRCDLELHNREGQSPLYLAVTSGKYSFVKMLIDAGAMTNAPNDDARQHTPLMAAVQMPNSQDKMPIIEYLMMHEANPRYWYSADGKLPTDVASPEVLDLFKKYGF